jgi:predicted anti-sigma-YlaC factor YlaD
MTCQQFIEFLHTDIDIRERTQSYLDDVGRHIITCKACQDYYDGWSSLVPEPDAEDIPMIDQLANKTLNRVLSENN